MFWVLIRNASARQGASNEYPQQMFSRINKKCNMWIPSYLELLLKRPHNFIVEKIQICPLTRFVAVRIIQPLNISIIKKNKKKKKKKKKNV